MAPGVTSSQETLRGPGLAADGEALRKPAEVADLGCVTAEWLPYRLPLRRPWISAAGALAERRGRLLRLDAGPGATGWGDAAPFPDIGITAAAATAWAEDCARQDLAAQAAGLPLAAWLAGEEDSGRASGDASKKAGAEAATSLAVNAALGDILSLDPARIGAAGAAGFSILKLKVGSADPAAELARLERLSDALPPGIAWRLDANGAWSEATAARFLAACARLPVEGVEEPLARPSAAALARLQADLPFPLAVDESWHLVDAAFLAAPPVRRLILKPPRHGGLLAALRFGRTAAEAGLECVVTSSLESACGLTAVAHLAAAVAPRATHGLATADVFLRDTGRPPSIQSGRLHLPAGPGLGFQPGLPPPGIS